MKKTFNSWKIWTLLSALIFFLTCWVFVAYAAGGGGMAKFYDKYNTYVMTGTLTAPSWNSLMKDLDRLIPDGAVMAFATGSCPEWWTDYELANWRFIVWIWEASMANWTKHTYTNVFGGIWWNYYTKLNVRNLPPHNHKLEIGRRWADSANDNEQAISIWHSKPWGMGIETTTYWRTENNWDSSTAGQMAGESFDTAIPYVGLKYCIKWNYNFVDSCPWGYSSTKPDCDTDSGWWELQVTQSNFNTYQCRRCEARKCEQYNPNFTTCNLNVVDLPQYTWHVTNPAEGSICVWNGCCVDKREGDSVAAGPCQEYPWH